MENSLGEDSGLAFEDNSNIVDDNSLQQFQPESVDETDEGISIAASLNNVNQEVMPCFVPEDLVFSAENSQGVGGGSDDDEAAQQVAMFQQQLEMGGYFAEDSNSLNQSLLEQAVADAGIPAAVEEEDAQQDLIPPAGDDNNNDRPDDVNNNTTDPQMQQFQQQQQQLLQQQVRQLEAFQQVYLAVEPLNNEADSDNQEQEPEKELIETNGNTAAKQSKEKRKKKKKKKKNRLVTVIGSDGTFKKQSSEPHDEERITGENGVHESRWDENDVPEEEVEIEYVPETLQLSVFDPLYRAFANVFENFRITEIKKPEEDPKLKEEQTPAASLKKVPKIDLDDDLDNDEVKDDKPKMSKRKLKKLTRLSIAELKQVVPRPDVVEMHDVTARDPKLLVHLKSYRNTVPVPRHWCYKRKYLQGKRGIEKAPFDLPAFIKKTGIMEMRAALAEKEETKTLKAKIRERVRPKMGKIDIDYQKLHDAFFKWQSKPKMTIHGDLYYEGKEFETRMKDKKPGELSDDLRTALGMPVGPNSQRVPPPWLIAMQRYGPPPSYPHLKVPGLNAPIPEGCSFGYHAGGWGKPPVDEFGRPLYGDVFGITSGDAAGGLEEENVDRTLWGELESEEEAESEEEDEEEEKDEEETENDEDSGLQTPAEGLQTPSGFSSVPAGLETPDMIELRKKRIEADMEGNDTPALYTVLPEKRSDRIGGAMMASTHVYDMSVVNKEKAPRGVPMGGPGAPEQGRVELILDPSELDLVDNEGTLAARYEQQLKEQQSHLQKEDLSDMVAEHAAKQKSKRKRQMQQQDVKQAKKYKEFKF